jgi:hypothetical protein
VLTDSLLSSIYFASRCCFFTHRLSSPFLILFYYSGPSFLSFSQQNKQTHCRIAFDLIHHSQLPILPILLIAHSPTRNCPFPFCISVCPIPCANRAFYKQVPLRNHASDLLYAPVSGAHRLADPGTFKPTVPVGSVRRNGRTCHLPCLIPSPLTRSFRAQQNPPPPPSSTKSNRLFGRGGFGK